MLYTALLNVAGTKAFTSNRQKVFKAFVQVTVWTKEYMEQKCLSLPEKLIEELENESKRLNISEGEITRTALIKHLEV